MDRQIFLLKFLILTIAMNLSTQENYAQEIQISYPTERSKATLTMGTAINPAGETLLSDSKSLLMDGQPFIPVMGEFHYSRYNENEWKRELLKMKAGGITVVASYVFWIHHEEEKGVFDWSGSRDLHRFVETCHEVDLPIVLRIGPFCHGEARHGGLPDWIIDSSCKIRSLDPAFLEYVRIWYANIYNQVKGLFWKDGGPVIGVQFDNEYGGEWAYLKALKDMAVKIGFDAPLYTRTGWPQLSTPATFGEILPLYGDYSDGFWNRELTDMPGEYADAYLFRASKISTVIASEQFTTSTDEELSYPYFTCELGGGMMPSYHRRVNIAPLDIHAMSIVKIGSGSNLPGYYMYHGGTNPKGIYHTLNEKQNSLYMNHNDLPVLTYDFQTPLGEFGQINEHYHWLRRTHNFLADFGSLFSDMDLVLPEKIVPDAKGKDNLRWAVRSNGESGYVFVNNYQRMRTLSDKRNVRFMLHLPEEILKFPEKPVTIPSGASFFLPFNLQVSGMTVKYATTQPFAHIRNGETETLFMAGIKGLPAELMLSTDVTIISSIPYIQSKNGYLFKDLQPGTDCYIEVRTKEGNVVRIVILDEESSLQSYKVKVGDQEYLYLTTNGLSFQDDKIFLEQWGNGDFTWSVYPAGSTSYPDKSIQKIGEQNLFTKYKAIQTLTSAIPLNVIPLRGAGPPRLMRMGSKNVAEQPTNEEFEELAAKWSIKGLETVTDPQNSFIKITYEGDVARVYADGDLIEDNFYNGRDMYVPVSKLAGKEAILYILPLDKDYPIYFQEDIRGKLNNKILLELRNVEIAHREIIELEHKAYDSL